MKLFTQRKKFGLPISLGIFLFIAMVALAASGPSQLKGLISSGGSQVNNGTISLSSAFGQPVAGTVSKADMILINGFWGGIGNQVQPPSELYLKIYLPIIESQ